MGPLSQGIIVALIVGTGAVCALWTLLPAAARRALATQALRLPLPSVLAAPLRRAAQPGHGGGCDGCDRAAPQPAASSEQRVTFHPRPPR